MVDDTVDLDQRRGMAAQQATEIRRLVREVADDKARLVARQDALEHFMAASPAVTWAEATDKLRYLLSLFLATSEGEDPRRRKLVTDLLSDIEKLLAGTNDNQLGTKAASTEGDEHG